MIKHITPARSGKWLKCLQYKTVVITSLVVEQMAYAQILQLIAIDAWVPWLTIHVMNYIYSTVSHCYVNAYGLKHEPMFCWFGTSSKFMSRQISPLLQLLSSLHHPLPTNGLEKQTWLLTSFKLHLAICVRKRMPCKNIKICLTSLPFSLKYNCRKLFCFSQYNPHNHWVLKLGNCLGSFIILFRVYQRPSALTRNPNQSHKMIAQLHYPFVAPHILRAQIVVVWKFGMEGKAVWLYQGFHRILSLW